MKERFYKFYETFVFTSVAIALACQAAFDQTIYKLQILKGHENVALLMAILSAAGIFYLLFSLQLTLYKVFFWKVFNRKYYIHGRWNAVITKQKGQPEKLYGEVFVDQTFDKIVFSAKHYEDIDKKNTWSHWESSNVIFHNGLIEVYWTVKRLKGQIITGKISFKVDGNSPPTILDGIFVDDGRSGTYGHMHYKKVIG